MGSDDCSFGDVTEKCSEIVSGWSSEDLGEVTLIDSVITNILEEVHKETLVFNNDYNKRFSLMEDVLSYKDGKYIIVTTNNLSVGDSLVIYTNGEKQIIPITNIEKISETTKTLLFYRDPFGLIVAGGMLAYNGCPTEMLTN